MQTHTPIFAVLMAVLGLASLAGAQTVRTSVDSAGSQASGASWNTGICLSGRHVFFVSTAPDLISGVTGQQVYARDRDPDGNGVFDEGNGVTTLMSLGYDGLPGSDVTDSGLSGFYGVDCSNDGRFVVYSSRATNLVPGDTTGRPHFDVFVRDRDPDQNGVYDEGNGFNTRVSLGWDGTEANHQDNGRDQLAISGDGRYVVYSSSSTNLISDDTFDHTPNIYIHDMMTGARERLDETTSTINVGNRYPHISANGEWIVFAGSADQLLGFFTHPQVIAVHRTTAATAFTLISKDDNGVPGNQSSGFGSELNRSRISADGRFVVYVTLADNLDVTRQGDQLFQQKCMLHDRDSDGNGVFDEPGGFTTRRIDVGPSGDASSGNSSDADITDDGSTIVFASQGNNLVIPDATPSHVFGVDVYRYDRLSGVLDRINLATDGTQGNHSCRDVAIAGSGEWTTYSTRATNLVSNDTNGFEDAFVSHSGSACPADWNGDGVLNTSDFLAYLNDYNAASAGNPTMFGDPDLVPPIGVLNTADFLAYLNLYNAGC